MPKPKRRDRFWTYAEASRTVPYVRCLLATVRETGIACRHLYFKSLRAGDGEGTQGEWMKYRDEGMAALDELDLLGVGLYQSPLRGIALFRFGVEVMVDAVYSEDLIAYFVYRATRDQIETFAFAPDVYDHDGLLGAERPIPDVLKRGATYLKREEVPPVVAPAPENCPGG